MVDRCVHVRPAYLTILSMPWQEQIVIADFVRSTKQRLVAIYTLSISF